MESEVLLVDKQDGIATLTLNRPAGGLMLAVNADLRFGLRGTRARQLAERIRDNAPLSVMAGKAALLRAASLGCDAALAEAKRLYQPVYVSEDAIEGPRAFAEKRPPVWRGR